MYGDLLHSMQYPGTLLEASVCCVQTYSYLTIAIVSSVVPQCSSLEMKTNHTAQLIVPGDHLYPLTATVDFIGIEFFLLAS